MKTRQTFCIDTPIAAQLELFAERFGISKSEMVTQLLRVNLPKLAEEQVFWVLKDYPARKKIKI